MRELLILSLLAFLLHCSWVETAVQGTIAVNCLNLTGNVVLADVSTCQNLIAPKTTVQLSVKGVDDQTWSSLAAQLLSVTNVDIVIEETTLTKVERELLTISSSNLIVKNNPSLTNVEIGVKVTSDLSGFTISDNSELKTVAFRDPQSKGFVIKTGKIDISNNKILEVVNITGTDNLAGLNVEGNRHLNYATLQMFKAVNMNGKPTYVQDEGECIFKKNISDLGELIGCKYVKGGLKIDHNAKGDAKGVKLTKITGEVNLGNLPKEKAAFLDGADVPAGQIKSDICVELTTKTKPTYTNQKLCDAAAETKKKKEEEDKNKNKNSGGGLSLGAIIGIIVGLLVVVVIIVCLLMYFCWWKKRKSGGGKKSKKTKTGDGQTTTGNGGGKKKNSKVTPSAEKAPAAPDTTNNRTKPSAGTSQSTPVEPETPPTPDVPDPLNPGKGIPLRDDGVDLDSTGTEGAK